MALDENIEDLISSISYENLDSNRLYRFEEIHDVVSEIDRVSKMAESFTSKLQAECKAAKENLSQLDKERSNARKDVINLKEDDASVNKKLDRLKTKIRDLQYEIKHAQSRSSITEDERKIVEQNDTELYCYKKLTGIRWNFDAPDDVIEGIITNSKKTYVQPIHFKKSEPIKKIRKTLWGYIKAAASESWDDLEDNKENQQNCVNKP